MKFVGNGIIEPQGVPILWSFENIGDDDWEHLKSGMVSALTFAEAIEKVKRLIGPGEAKRGHNYRKHVFEFKPEGVDLVKDREESFLLVDWNHG